MLSVAEKRYHNESVLETLQPGDAIEFIRTPLYSHWGLYVGGGNVIHLTGDAGGILQSGSRHVSTSRGKQNRKACVRMDNFFDVAENSRAFKNNSKDRRFSPKSVDEIIETAMSMIGEIEYNLLWSNCEHFVSYCRSGVSKSDQADNVIYSDGIGEMFFTRIRGVLQTIHRK